MGQGRPSPSPRSNEARALLTGNDARGRTALPMRRLAETTQLTPEEEQRFQTWAKRYDIRDVDHPDSHYDYRGYWSSEGGQPTLPPHFPGGHFPDTWKQFGHPTFSEESLYSRGPQEGGRWIGQDRHGDDVLLRQPRLADTAGPRLPVLTGAQARPAYPRSLMPEPPAPAPPPQPPPADIQLPNQAGVDPRLLPRMRAATGMEQLENRLHSGYQAAARTLPGRVTEALGITDLAGVARSFEEPPPEVQLAEPPPIPFGPLTKRAQGAAARTGEAHLARAPVERVNGRLIISTRVPTAVKGVPVATEPLVSGMAEARTDPKFFAKIVEKVRSYPILTGRESRLSDEGVIQAATERITENFDALGRMQSPAERREGAKWYRGGQRLGDEIAVETTRVGPERVTGDQGTFLIASQSPTREWPQNISLAQRMARWWQEFNRTDQRFTRDHFNRFVDTTLQSAEDWIKKKKYDTPKVDPTGEKAKASRMRARAKIEDARTYIDLPWSGLPQLQRARLLRAHSELSEPQTYAILDPEGNIIEAVAKNPDKTDRVVVWQSYGNMQRGLWILDDPSDANLSLQVGKGQKVRSFANNLSVPEDPRSFTVDTHEIAGAHFQPFGGTAKEVKDVMAGPASVTGLKGLHPLYRDAGIEAARWNRVIPNQQQSISWQGVQGLFSPSQRRDTKFIADVRAMWEEYGRGRISVEDLLGRIYDYAAYHRGTGGLGAAPK